MSYKKNDEIKLEIIDITKEGLGLAKLSGQVFFVKDAIVGDVVRAAITKVSDNVIYAKAKEILSKSNYRVDADCTVSNACGGCQLLNLDYEEQLKLKKKYVLNCLSKIAKCDVDGDGIAKDFIYDGVLKMSSPYHFRNKMQVPFVMRDGKIIYGFYAGRTHHIVEFNKCLVGFEYAEVILDSIKEALSKYPISIYDEVSKTGVFREVLLRCGNTSSQISITYILNDKDYKKNIHLYNNFDESVRKQVKEKLDKYNLFIAENASSAKKIYEVVTSTININLNNTNVLFGNTNVTLSGNGYIEDKIGDIRYNISPESFYQVNMEMTKVLYDKILDFASIKGDEEVLDLYCGIGTISLYVSRYVKKVLGIEIVDKAITNAKNNMKINGISNAEFICKDVNDDLSIEKKHFDIVIVDPPRKGLEEKVISQIKEIKPEKIIYVSCDPATLSRDIDCFCHKEDSSYTLKRVVNVDMFPHTMHIETIALMSRE